MTNEYITGIDIGTTTIKIVISEQSHPNTAPQILYAIISPSHGFRHGYITDLDIASKSLSIALKKIEKVSKMTISEARFSISGAGLSSQYVRTGINISEKNNEISEQHINDVIQKSERLFSEKYPNKKILHIIPVKYSVDSRDVLGSPIGMYGSSLDVKIIFITILEHHFDSFLSLIDNQNIKINEIIASPLADSEASANYEQKSQGCVIVNIGSETTSISTFENGIITSLKINSIGSNDISNDIALGLQISLEEAQNIKTLKNKEYPKRKVDEIIHARIADILELTENHLRSIKKNRLLPAGIIFSGGGSRIEFIEDYAKKTLRLPAGKTAVYKYTKKTKRNTNIGPDFSIAYGLCFTNKNYQPRNKKRFSFKNIKNTFSNLFNQIMP